MHFIASPQLLPLFEGSQRAEQMAVLLILRHNVPHKLLDRPLILHHFLLSLVRIDGGFCILDVGSLSIRASALGPSLSVVARGDEYGGGRRLLLFLVCHCRLWLCALCGTKSKMDSTAFEPTTERHDAVDGHNVSHRRGRCGRGK